MNVLPSYVGATLLLVALMLAIAAFAWWPSNRLPEPRKLLCRVCLGKGDCMCCGGPTAVDWSGANCNFAYCLDDRRWVCLRCGVQAPEGATSLECGETPPVPSDLRSDVRPSSRPDRGSH